MHVITVIFVVKAEHLGAFQAAMKANARASLENEPGCHQFDVAYAPDAPTTCFLYELYNDEAAFRDHLASAHFKNFDAKVAPWLASKTVNAYQRAWP